MTCHRSLARAREKERHMRGDYSGPTVRDRVCRYVASLPIGATFWLYEVNMGIIPSSRNRLTCTAQLLREVPFCRRVGERRYERIEGSSYWMRDPVPAGDLRQYPAHPHSMPPAAMQWIYDMQEQDPEGLMELWSR